MTNGLIAACALKTRCHYNLQFLVAAKLGAGLGLIAEALIVVL